MSEFGHPDSLDLARELEAVNAVAEVFNAVSSRLIDAVALSIETDFLHVAETLDPDTHERLAVFVVSPDDRKYWHNRDVTTTVYVPIPQDADLLDADISPITDYNPDRRVRIEREVDGAKVTFEVNARGIVVQHPAGAKPVEIDESLELDEKTRAVELARAVSLGTLRPFRRKIT